MGFEPWRNGSEPSQGSHAAFGKKQKRTPGICESRPLRQTLDLKRPPAPERLPKHQRANSGNLTIRQSDPQTPQTPQTSRPDPNPQTLRGLGIPARRWAAPPWPPGTRRARGARSCSSPACPASPARLGSDAGGKRGFTLQVKLKQIPKHHAARKLTANGPRCCKPRTKTGGTCRPTSLGVIGQPGLQRNQQIRASRKQENV